MSLLKFFQKARSTSAATSESAVEADPQSQSGEPSDELTDSEGFGSDIEPADESDDDGPCDERVPGPPPTKKVCGAACGDVATYIGKSKQLSVAVKHNLLVGHFRPSDSFKFPRSANGRSFQYRWLQQYPWLCYSKQENGGLCLPCVLFASDGYHGSDPGILVSRPLVSFAKALETFRKHAVTEHHKLAILRADNFKKVMENQQPGIQQLINQAMADRVASNRQKLASILKVIVLCGRQNMALRGHRDNITDLESDTLSTENHGNFWALLNFRVDSGDTVIGEHLATASRNATYTSSVIQNQLVDVAADQIRQKILQRVKRAVWYTVISDEVTDISNKEQLSVVLRYVDPDTDLVREDLISFFECDEGITGSCIAKKITDSLESFGLDLGKLRGQSYDGAGNMAGTIRGTAALISAQYPLALYLHCASHALNLAVVKSLGVTSVRNMVGVVDRVSTFFSAHPKRQRALESAIAENQPESVVSKLKDLCRTRWVQRIDALNVFQSLHPSIVACMETICSDGWSQWSADSVTDAQGLQLALTTTDFVSALVITNSCLKYRQALTSNLQAEARDIVESVKEISSVKAALQDVRDNVITYHSRWFKNIEQMLASVGEEPRLPRRCGRQSNRSNVPADSPCEYYCRCISIPVLDHLLSEMETRFSSHQQTALLGLSMVPSVLVSLPAEEYATKSMQLAKMYNDDLPSPDCVESELHCWQLKWQQQFRETGSASLPMTLSSTLRQVTPMYPNIKVLIAIMCTLPVTSCSAERSFSGLKRIKTPLRSSMVTERLTGLTLLHIHRDIPVDIDAAINEFARRHPRRLQLANILAD